MEHWRKGVTDVVARAIGCCRATPLASRPNSYYPAPMKPQVSYQVFLALATIAWANGTLAPEEREGILSAARHAGYSEPELAYLSKLIETPVAVSSLALHRLSGRDRIFVCAAAEWVARVDGHVDPSEVAALQALGDRLRVAEPVREKARRAVVEIAKLPGGNRPDRFDLVKLRELLDQIT
jgi:uncharacterized membrane protein YebE (DUF533 family)